MIDRQIITSHDKHELIDWLFIFEIFKCDFHSIKSKETVYDYSDTTKRVRLDWMVICSREVWRERRKEEGLFTLNDRIARTRHCNRKSKPSRERDEEKGWNTCWSACNLVIETVSFHPLYRSWIILIDDVIDNQLINWFILRFFRSMSIVSSHCQQDKSHFPHL